MATDPFGLTIPAANCKATAAQCAATINFLHSEMNVSVTLSGRSAAGLAKIDYRRSHRNQFTFEGNAGTPVVRTGAISIRWRPTEDCSG